MSDKLFSTRFVVASAYIGGVLALTSTTFAAVYTDRFLSGTTPSAGEYAANTNLVGQGPTVTGFSGNWSVNSGSDGAITISSGLTSPKILDEAGGAVQTDSSKTASTLIFSRTFTASTTITGGGSGSGAMYGSMLLYTPAAAAYTSTTGTASFRLGGAILGVTLSGGTLRPIYQTTTDSSTALSSDTYLLVVKIAPSAATWSASSNDNISYWMYPLSSATIPISEPGTPMYTASANVVGNTGTLTLAPGFQFKGVAATFDELKIGGSWAEVVVVPEPASIAVIGTVGLLIVRRRRA